MLRIRHENRRKFKFATVMARLYLQKDKLSFVEFCQVNLSRINMFNTRIEAFTFAFDVFPSWKDLFVDIRP